MFHVVSAIWLLACALCAGCSPRPGLSVLVPVVTLTLSAVKQQAGTESLASRTRTDLTGVLVLSFAPRVLQAPLPSAFEVAPELAASPCEEEDTTCLAEAQPLSVGLQRWLAELP